MVWEIWRVMLSQWNRAGMDGQRVGLKYEVIRPVADLLELEIDRRGFLWLVRMEREHLAALAERKGA